MFISNVVIPSLVSAFGWGLTPIFHRLNIIELDNNYIVAFAGHCIFIALISLPFCLAYFGKFNNLLQKPNIKKILFYTFGGAFTSVVLGYYFYFKAMAKAKNTLLVVLIVYIVPLVVTTLVSHFYLKEKINLGMIAGLLISIFGIVVFTKYSKDKIGNK